MIRKILFALLLPLSLFAQNQTKGPIAGYTNTLRLNVVDVIDQHLLKGCTIMIVASGDTVTTTSITGEFTMKVKSDRKYTITVSMPGYETMSADWSQPQDPADVFVDIYMHKNTMTKKERKRALKKSQSPIRHLSPYGIPDTVLPPKDEMLLSYTAWYTETGSSTTIKSSTLGY